MITRRLTALLIISLLASLVMLFTACGNYTVPATPPASSGQAPPATSAQPSTPVAPTEVERGKLLYESNCAACHGQLGEGGKAPDGTIAPPMSAHLRGHAGLENGAEHVAQSVLDGIHEEDGSPHELSPAMPRFRGILSEAQVADIIAYMETLP